MFSVASLPLLTSRIPTTSRRRRGPAGAAVAELSARSGPSRPSLRYQTDQNAEPSRQLLHKRNL